MTYSNGKPQPIVDFTSLVHKVELHERSRIGPAFYAAYRSECAACGTVIDEGDLAGYVDDEVVCEDCHADVRSTIDLD